MVTWKIDRFLRLGPVLALVTFAVPVALAIMVNALSDVENVLGVLLLGSGIIFIGTLTGSIVASGLGAVLFSLGAVLAEISPFVLLIVGVALFATLMVHDLAGAFRRAPNINRAVWMNAVVSTAFVALTASVMFTFSHFVGELATWQSIVVPFGIAAIGFAMKLAADSHVVQARQLTRKRDRST